MQDLNSYFNIESVKVEPRFESINVDKSKYAHNDNASYEENLNNYLKNARRLSKRMGSIFKISLFGFFMFLMTLAFIFPSIR